MLLNSIDDLDPVEQLQLQHNDAYAQWWAAGMPSFDGTVRKKLYKKVTIKFPTYEDRKDFFDNKIELTDYSDNTKYLKYPLQEREVHLHTRFIDTAKTYNTTKYPIYIISKGRWESRLTARALDNMGVPYRIAVEPQEFDNYAKTCGADKLLVLPFSNHGKGSGPARNWCWEHSISEGHEKHWLLDDNIYEFWRYHKGQRIRADKGTSIFRATEDFTDRYENIGLTGFHYKFFAVEDNPYPPYILNSRIMSCFLIDNKIPHRWRGKYNEDVDLSIRVLKDGYVTLLTYAFLCGKARTGTVKGGNTSEVYNNYEADASYNKSKMLVEMHPDCVSLVERYGRIHHEVDLNAIMTKDGYPAINNKLILKKNVSIKNAVDNYGMDLYKNLGLPEEYIDKSYSENKYPIGRRIR
jgi:hypothetical protein